MTNTNAEMVALVDASITTNGNRENTGARVNAVWQAQLAREAQPNGVATLDGEGNVVQRWSYASRVAVAASEVPAQIPIVLTYGYASEGDGGGGVYRRVGAEPSHQGKVQSADGAWWELQQDKHGANPCQFGADRTGAVACDAAFRDCWAYAIAKYQGPSSNRGISMDVSGGVYLLVEGNVLGGTAQSAALAQWNLSGRKGDTQIKFKPTASAKFSDDDVLCALYDGGTPTGTKSTVTLSRGTISGITFLLDGSDASLAPTDTVVGYRNYQQNGWTHFDVEFVNANTFSASHAKTYAYVVEGSVNGAEMRFFGGAAKNMSGICINKNPQAVNHEFYGFDGNTIYDHFFVVDGGALSFKYIGGHAVWATDGFYSAISGAHTGSGNAATLTDSGAAFPTDNGGLVGALVNNTTDGSSGIITANTATTITATLSGGSDNDWDTSDAYTVKPLQCLVAIQDASGLGSTNGAASFVDIKPEMRHAGAALVRSLDATGRAKITFSQINFEGGGITGARGVTALSINKSVHFKGCSIPGEFWFVFNAADARHGSTAWSDANEGLVTLDECDLAADLSTHVAKVATPGRVIARRSFQTAGAVATANEMRDFDTNPLNHGTGESTGATRRGTVVGKRALWTSAKTFTLLLSYGSRIKSVEIYLPGAGADTTSRTITVQDGNGATLATASGAENADILGLTTLQGTAAGVVERTTTNQRTISASIDGLATSRRNGWVIVECQ